MNNGWVKLHRKVIDNPIFRRDRTAWHIFETLLIMADRRTGKWSGGIWFQLAELVNEKGTTTYKAIKRLEKAKMVRLVSNNKYSDIYICNWKRHQDVDNTASNNKVITKGEQSKTLTRSKEVKNTNTNVLVDKRDPNITLLISSFESQVGKMPRPSHQIMAASELIKEHGLERSLGAVKAVSASRDERYAPSISSLEELRDNWVKLENFYRRKTNQAKGAKIR